MLTISRSKNVRKKLNAMALEFADKNVLLVDGTFHYLGLVVLCDYLSRTHHRFNCARYNF